jgi:hypothetical protein
MLTGFAQVLAVWHRLLPRGALAFAAGCALLVCSVLLVIAGEWAPIPD